MPPYSTDLDYNTVVTELARVDCGVPKQTGDCDSHYSTGET